MAVAIILVLSANTKIVTLWAMYAVTWLVHAIVTSYLSNGWIRIARLLFVWQIGVMPGIRHRIFSIRRGHFSGGATIACGLGLAAYALVQYASLTIDSQNNSNRITPERSGIRLPPCTTCSAPSASTHPPYAIALFPLPCSGQVSRSLPTATTLVDTPISAQRYRQLTMQVLSLIASAMKLWDC